MEKRIFGATDGIRDKAGSGVLRPNMMRGLGKALAKYFGGEKLLIARDTRKSGTWINDEIHKGIEQAGGRLDDFDIIPTPAIAALIRDDVDAAGGVMITASHNPASDNGIKVFDANGEKIDDDVELAIEDIIFSEDLEADIDAPEVKLVQADSAKAAMRYTELVREKLGEVDFSGYEVLLDAASGAAHDFSRLVFADFGISAECIDDEPNGDNINLNCGALFPEHMAKVARERDMLGVTLDGDGDRVMLIDEEGRIWDGDRISSMLACYLKEKGELKNNTIVYTEYSNLGAIQWLNSKDINVDKVVNGDRKVAQKCKECGYALGSEFSGHIIYLPWLTSSDGTFMTLLILKILQEKQCRLADLWPDYEMAPSKQWGIMVRERKALEEIPGWNEAVAEVEAQFAGNGRVFCRYSGTENKLRILVESDNMEKIEEAGEKLAEIVRKEIGQ